MDIFLLDLLISCVKLADFTNLFLPNNFLKKWSYNYKLFDDWCLRTFEWNSIEAPKTYPCLNDKQQFRLNKINEIKDYLFAKIKER